MNHEGELNVDPVRGGISPDAVKASLQPDSLAKACAAIPRNEEITQKIRNPLPAPAVPPAEGEPEAPVANEVTPCVAPVIELSMDISKNLHPQDILPPPTEDIRPAAKRVVNQPDRSSDKSAKVRHKGLIVVAVIVIAGTSIDVALWLTSGTPQARTERSVKTTAPASTLAGGEPVPGMSRAPSTLPKVEPLPADNHVEAMAAVGAPATNSDNPKDRQARAMKSSQSGPLPVLAPAGAASPPSEGTVRTKRDGKFKLPPRGGDDFGGELRSTKARRTTTTIDESNPYAP